MAVCFAIALSLAIAVAALDAIPRQAPWLRVMTWNIAAGHGDLSKIADGIRDANPDVAALQEVDVHWMARSGFADQAARLAELVGMQVRFAPIYQLPGEGMSPLREFGVAILSKHPIVEFRNHPLPRLSTQSAATEPELLPGFAEATIEIGGGRVRVFTTHLDYRAAPRVRELQVASTLTRLDGGGGPTVLMGDLNAPPAAPELAPLFERLQDAWSADGDSGFTYPADVPVRRIDYILLSRALRALHVRVVPTHASDHRPVVADLARVN